MTDRITNMVYFTGVLLGSIDRDLNKIVPGEYVAVASGFRRGLHDTELNFRMWKYMKVVSTDDITVGLRLHWTSACLSDAEKVISVLEKNGILRKISKDRWNVVRPKKEKPSTVDQAYRKAVKPNYEKIKPGTCRKCEGGVRNTNRHNNPSHTPDECKYRIIKNILEE